MSTALVAPSPRLAALLKARDAAERRLADAVCSPVASALRGEFAASTFAARIVLRDLERLDAAIARES